MNDEARELGTDEVLPVDDAADAAAGLVSTLQDEVDELRAALVTSETRVAELETERDSTPPLAAAPVGDESLRALAATVRQCQKNGHPDLAAHLNTLLTTLGAL